MSENTTWSDEDKQAVVDQYTEAGPTEENTMDIVTEIAEQWDKSPNSIRMILSRANVYVKKSTPAKSENSKSKRIIKADALEDLTNIIKEKDLEVNEDIIARLTGKAAVYFKEIIETVSENGEES